MSIRHLSKDRSRRKYMKKKKYGSKASPGSRDYSGNEVTIVVFKDTIKPNERSQGCFYNASGGIKKINSRGVPIKK